VNAELSVNVHVFATDYDGTIADANRVAPSTAQALERVRATGRKLLLVTGRMLPDLRAVCPDLDRMFDAVVAENGALVYFPDRRELRTLGDPPEPALVDALRRRGVRFDLGEAILATDAPFAEAVLAAIQETGVDRTPVFNKGALMLLPGGVTKGTGLSVALAALQLSAHNMVGIGDAENDHAFLALSECAVAVADAVPALRERADYVTRAPSAAGVVEFIEEHLLHDLVDLIPRLTRHDLPVGEQTGGQPLAVAAHGTRLLIVGPSGSGKSTLTGVLTERILESGRSLLLLDPEGDYRTLSELERVVVFGGKGERALPTAEEIDQLLRQPAAGLVLDLSAMSRSEKVTYATTVLSTVATVRSSQGLPHWLVVDEAHHVFPAEGSPAAELLRPGAESLVLITLAATDLAARVRPLANVVVSTEVTSFRDAVRTVLAGRDPGAAMAVGDGALDRGEAALALIDPAPRAVRFRVGRRRVQHRRHLRKYTEGELPTDRSFFFRGPTASLNLRAANLVRFVELAEGVDEATWAFHLERGEYSAWVRDMIKDPELADEIVAVERAGLPAAESRAQILAALRQRYAV
jgi:hydroxymethylpyrimidine pyrophosphatase-like HAD family hydrolase/energy-coupling factor transporter ATP-binding protein EcfA2